VALRLRALAVRHRPEALSVALRLRAATVRNQPEALSVALRLRALTVRNQPQALSAARSQWDRRRWVPTVRCPPRNPIVARRPPVPTEQAHRPLAPIAARRTEGMTVPRRQAAASARRPPKARTLPRPRRVPATARGLPVPITRMQHALAVPRPRRVPRVARGLPVPITPMPQALAVARLLRGRRSRLSTKAIRCGRPIRVRPCPAPIA
jgi:hypothetical protein